MGRDGRRVSVLARTTKEAGVTSNVNEYSKSQQERVDTFNAVNEKLQTLLTRWWITLGRPDFAPLLKERTSGELRPSERAETQPVEVDLEEFLDAVLRWGRFSEDFLENILKGDKAAGDWLDGLVRFTQRLETIIDGTEQWARNLSFRVQPLLEELAKQGWYLHPQFPVSVGTLESTTQTIRKQPELTQNTLRDFFRGRLDDIESDLVKSYPNRELILRDAFQAHREGKYTPSVPVFLAQADGITHDVVRKHIFQESTRKDLRRSLPPSEYGFAEAILNLLVLRKLPLWKPGQGTSPEDHLNRHRVLHGTSVDYGNEINSLKAVSFLAWVPWAMSFIGKAENGKTD